MTSSLNCCSEFHSYHFFVHPDHVLLWPTSTPDLRGHHLVWIAMTPSLHFILFCSMFFRVVYVMVCGLEVTARLNTQSHLPCLAIYHSRWAWGCVCSSHLEASLHSAFLLGCQLRWCGKHFQLSDVSHGLMGHFSRLAAEQSTTLCGVSSKC